MSHKLYFEAMKKLPDEFVDDETQTVTVTFKNPTFVIAVNPKLAPIKYTKAGGWEKIELQDETTFGPDISGDVDGIL